MKITFPNKEQAREAFENAMRFTTKYSWRKDTSKRLDLLKDICKLKI